MFRFGDPDILYFLFVPAVMLVLYFLVRLIQGKRLRRSIHADSLKNMLAEKSTLKDSVKAVCMFIAGVLLIVSLAHPQYGTRLEEVTTEGSDIVIALDISNSMLAEDLAPNRLERAKASVSKLIGELKGDRIGLVAFAGKAFLQLPLTTDYSAAKLMLSGLDTDIIGTQGTAIGAAIETAIEAFPEESQAGRTIVVITDGENHEDDALSAAEKANDLGITLHTIGMGKKEGAPIPVTGRPNTYIKDNEGNTVVTKLDETALRQIAAKGNGDFVRVSGGSPDLSSIIAGVEELEKTEFGTKKITDYEERYQWPLAAAMVFLTLGLVIGDRKSKLGDFVNKIAE
ncbi:MAG: VWA domain-containing protein [Candidatus Kapaibacteriales bacterium]